MSNMTIERAIQISNLEEGKRRPSVAILSDAIEVLQKDGGTHDEAVVRIRAIMDGKKPKKAPKAVASAKAPEKKQEEPKAPEKQAEKPKAKETKPKAPRKPRVPQKPKGNPDFVPNDMEAFNPTKMDDIKSALAENPYRIMMLLEEEDNQGNPTITVFRVLYLSSSANKLVLFDETTQKGQTVTADLKEILLTKHLFRDTKSKEDFKIQFAIFTKQA